MLDKQTHTLIAQRLNQAEKQREQIRAVSLDYPNITIEDAYAVQREWVNIKIAEGRTLKGHKIGLTSKAMQASSQISEPDYGALLDDMFFHDGGDIPTDRFIVPRIEVELAFVLAKPLRGPHCTLFDVYNATDYVIPALELIDARSHNIDPETQRPRQRIIYDCHAGHYRVGVDCLRLYFIAGRHIQSAWMAVVIPVGRISVSFVRHYGLVLPG